MHLTTYVVHDILMRVKWAVDMADEFEQEFEALREDVQNEILALSMVLEQFGPGLGRPRADTPIFIG